MASLTAKQESFIKLMTESEELARRGFDLLLKRTDFDQFFDALKEARLFEPSCNPAPVAAEEEGYFRIPYWSALDYLIAVAKLSGEKSDLPLANKVMAVVRSVSRWRESGGHTQENYHTSRKFAEILGLVPTAAVTFEDLGLIEIWLNDKFERGMVSHALDEGALSHFLASPSPEDSEKAVVVLRHCTAIRWQPAKGFGDHERKPTTLVEDFWLKELLKHHAGKFGAKIGEKAAETLLERVCEIFGSESRKLPSRIYRPAIEDHNQNHDLHGAENRSVEGLRDVLLSWCEHDPGGAKLFVNNLLAHEIEILRRLGIYVLAKQWTELRTLYAAFLGPKLFDSGHLHELYNLLKERFADLTEEEKAHTIDAIRQIPPPTWGEDPTLFLKRIQQRWLSATAGNGYQPAEQWFSELQADPSVGPLSGHRDFDSYIEVSSGVGPSPYTVQELVAMATAGLVVEKLNSFEQQGVWRGPTMEGLVSAVEEAARIAPEPFFQLLPEFLKAKRPFQHSVIWGLKQAWEAKDGKKTEVDWNLGWERLITFFEQLIGEPEFWEEKVPEHRYPIPTRDWIISAIAESLQAGTRNDERAYSSELFPRTWPLIQILLDNARGVDQPPDDAMFQALNSLKGKAVEALFSYALRVCRTSDLANGSHAEAWEEVRPLFEVELEKCKNANYEFSTLAGAYLAQLDYMDREWVKTKVDQVFPSEFPLNSMCAIDGLAYTRFTRPVYALLAERGVLDRGLKYELKGRSAREKLLERIAVAYLWGEEALDSSRFSYVFESGCTDDLEVITTLFWRVRGDELSEDLKHRILDYWERCVAWSRALANPPLKLFSALSTLSSYLATADGKERELLEAVAPYVHEQYNADSFFKELLRLVEVSPGGVSTVLGKVVEAHVPSYDFEDRLKSLLLRLAEKGRKQDVILYAERLRSLSGMQDLFDRLTRSD